MFTVLRGFRLFGCVYKAMVAFSDCTTPALEAILALSQCNETILEAALVFTNCCACFLSAILKFNTAFRLMLSVVISHQDINVCSSVNERCYTSKAIGSKTGQTEKDFKTTQSILQACLTLCQCSLSVFSAILAFNRCIAPGVSAMLVLRGYVRPMFFTIRTLTGYFEEALAFSWDLIHCFKEVLFSQQFLLKKTLLFLSQLALCIFT